MEKAKETLTVMLMLYIIIGLFALMWQLLVLHTFPRFLSYSILISLVLLKSVLTNLRAHTPEQELSAADQSKIVFLLKLSLAIFCFVLFVSFLITDQPVAAGLSLLTLLLCASRIKTTNSFTDTNP